MKKELEKIKYNQTGTKTILFEDNLILLEYGRATYNVKENNEETKWVKDEFYKIAEKYPQKKFNILMDVTNSSKEKALAWINKK